MSHRNDFGMHTSILKKNEMMITLGNSSITASHEAVIGGGGGGVCVEEIMKKRSSCVWCCESSRSVFAAVAGPWKRRCSGWSVWW